MTVVTVKHADDSNNFIDFCPLVVNSKPKSSASDRLMSENDTGGEQSLSWSRTWKMDYWD